MVVLIIVLTVYVFGIPLSLGILNAFYSNRLSRTSAGEGENLAYSIFWPILLIVSPIIISIILIIKIASKYIIPIFSKIASKTESLILRVKNRDKKPDNNIPVAKIHKDK